MISAILLVRLRRVALAVGGALNVWSWCDLDLRLVNVRKWTPRVPVETLTNRLLTVTLLVLRQKS